MRRCLGCFESKKDDLLICPFCGFVDGTTAENAIHMDPGTILAQRYIIGRVLGFGGFGVTYIGWDAKLEQKVAIKEYLPSECSTRMPGHSRVTVFNGEKNDQFVSGLGKFVEEAKRLSKFQKEEGIARVFDCITENDTAYIIMEFLDGETLGDRLKRDKCIPEEEAIDLLMPVMKSLEVVHQEGIIHRDIAPDNIFLTKDGRVKLIDFGASRFAAVEENDPRSLTVIIKPGYSAEEQYRTRGDQGPHTDVYSVAATLYKMITGETPPDALERRAKIESIKKDILTEPHKLVKNVTLVTENAVLNALNIRIEDRTPTIKAFINDLKADEPVKRVYGKIKKIDLYRIPIWTKILVPSLILILMLFVTLIATGVIDYQSVFKTSVEIPEGYTTVPSVEGMDIDTAAHVLQECGLDYVTGGNVVSDYIDAGLIVYQTPEAGKLITVNSVVSITISRGTGDVILTVNGISTVPMFVWSEEDEAVRDFETAGFLVATEYLFDVNVAEGQVIRAADESGNRIHAGDELAEGTLITIYVSLGPEMVEVPDVYGMSEDDAVELLEQLGFVVNVEYTDFGSRNHTSGNVYGSDIETGTLVRLGSEITLEVHENAGTRRSVTPTAAPTVSPTPTTTADNIAVSPIPTETPDYIPEPIWDDNDDASPMPTSEPIRPEDTDSPEESTVTSESTTPTRDTDETNETDESESTDETYETDESESPYETDSTEPEETYMDSPETTEMDNDDDVEDNSATSVVRDGNTSWKVIIWC